MAFTGRGDRRKGNRRQRGRRKGDIEEVKVRQEEDKEQEVVVRHEAAPPPQKASSVWSWYEEFAAEWSETFITKKKKSRKMRRKGERNG